jgi:hypothetical protein
MIVSSIYTKLPSISGNRRRYPPETRNAKITRAINDNWPTTKTAVKAGWTIMVSFVQRCRLQFTKHRALVKVYAVESRSIQESRRGVLGLSLMFRVPVVAQRDIGNWGGNTSHTNIRVFWQINNISYLICGPLHVYRHTTLNDSQSLNPPQTAK